jgi:hypothetical protein
MGKVRMRIPQQEEMGDMLASRRSSSWDLLLDAWGAKL